MTLVILAAGMGSRYGGLKQLDPMTKHGEFIIDFSVFDARRVGIDKVIFIIKKETEDLFKDTIGNRIENHMEVRYAYQTLEMLPKGFDIPAGRMKPWGTVHALLCAKEVVGNDSMIVINADDFYGKDSYEMVANFLCKINAEKAEFCMPGYLVKNTLTENGSVSRGICSLDKQGKLTGVDERTQIYRKKSGRVVYEENGTVCPINENDFVSMNFWGFTPKIFPLLEKEFLDFLTSKKEDARTKELCLSTCIDSIVKKGECTVTVLPTKAQWYGVTYQQDKNAIVTSIGRLIENGLYPDGLFV